MGLAVGLLGRKLLTFCPCIADPARPGEGAEGNGEAVGNCREPQLVAGEEPIR